MSVVDAMNCARGKQVFPRAAVSCGHLSLSDHVLQHVARLVHAIAIVVQIYILLMLLHGARAHAASALSSVQAPPLTSMRTHPPTLAPASPPL